MKLTRRKLRGLIKESIKNIIFEADEAMVTVEGIEAGVSAAASNLEISYENLVNNLKSSVDGVKSFLALKTLYGISSSGGYGGGGGGQSMLYGLPLISPDSSLPFRNYETREEIPPEDYYGGPSLKVLDDLNEDERASVLKVLKRYYPLLVQSATIYAAAKGNSLIRLAALYDATFDDDEKSDAAAAIKRIIDNDPRAEMLDDGFIMSRSGLIKTGWDPSAVMFHKNVVDMDDFSTAAPILASEFDFHMGPAI